MGKIVCEKGFEQTESEDIIRFQENPEEMNLLSRPNSPETEDNELVKPSLDDTGIEITKDIGPFEKSFVEDNEIEISSEDRKDQLSKEDQTIMKVESEKEFEQTESEDILRIEENPEDMNLLSRPNSPETEDNELVKPSLDDAGIEITTDIGPFEKSFVEDNEIDISSVDQKEQLSEKDLTKMQVGSENE